MVEINIDEANAVARSVLLDERADGYGVSNPEKWGFVCEILPEIKEDGFFTDVDLQHVYDWEIGNRLLAFAYLTQLRRETHIKMHQEAIEKKLPPDQLIAHQWLADTCSYYAMKLMDKYSALVRGQSTWKHTWLQ